MASNFEFRVDKFAKPRPNSNCEEAHLSIPLRVQFVKQITLKSLNQERCGTSNHQSEEGESEDEMTAVSLAMMDGPVSLVVYS